jgi:DNA-binding NarL/FixJ family response regulator
MIHPAAKLIFLTQETDVDVARETFSLGACGYVLKPGAEVDVLAAISAILAGQRFISSGLGDWGGTSRRS